MDRARRLRRQIRDLSGSRVIWRVLLGIALVLSALWILPFYMDPDHIFVDAHIYYRATAAWVAGGNPWVTTYSGIPFAGIPPTLLLNLPLLLIGEEAAVAVWAVANSLSVVFLVRRLRLPTWTILMLPVLEGWLGAGPDLTLAALAVAGGGWVAVLTKPYSAPAIIAAGRWRQVVLAGAIGVASLPFLPWLMFYESREIVMETFRRFAGHPVSASGNVALMLVVFAALVSVGWRKGLALLTPGVLAQQPHYLVFSLSTITRSKILTLAAASPFLHAAAIGVVIFAVHNLVSKSRRTSWRQTAPVRRSAAAGSMTKQDDAGTPAARRWD